jgi:microcin C transport system substrate-binding protein
MRATIAAIAALMAFALPALGETPGAAEPAWRHASALSGDPRYPDGFAHFDYVNAAAPKGGTVRLASISGFDSFNPILALRGTAAPGISLPFETLMTPSFDEEDISAQYGLLAEALRYPDDYAWVEYRLDPAARWHDGTPVTAEDVVFSLEANKAANPRVAFYYRDVTGAEALDEHTVRFTFAGPGNRELPHIVGQLLILPKHWWTGTGANGAPRSVEQTTLEPPVGSGPYRIARFEPGRYVEYERVPDYWGAAKNVNVGSNNFDRIRYEVFRDQTVLLEAFRGDRYDFRVENSARDWATGYDFPAVRRGDVVKELFPDESRGIMQAFVMNLRLPRFQDERVRRALNLMYDFEAQKETIFYGQYDRIDSFFFGTDLAASGLPEGRELAILEEVRDLVPPSVFTEPYTNPVNGTPEKVRENAREAVRLFKEAGWEIRGGKMVNAATGEPFTIEVIDDSPAMERVVLPYQQSLARIGIPLSFRTVDTSQMENRMRSFDFEMTIHGWGQSLSPGNEQRDYWGSDAADRQGSQNYAGIKDPGIDKLIDKVIYARDREELVAATHALDRVLLHHNYVVPQYASRNFRTARWNRFGHPETIPPFNFGFPTIWWYDEGRAATVGSPS